MSIAAAVPLALGLFQDFGTLRPAGEPPVDWVEGVAIMVTIFIVVSGLANSNKCTKLMRIVQVMVGSVNDWQKERQFRVLNNKKEEQGVKVIRNGIEIVVGIHKVVVGDIALFKPGEIVPCNSVFLSGHNVKCDESGPTGESDAMRKVSYEECLALRNKPREEGASRGDIGHTDCFVVSGSRVLEGVGSYVVVVVSTKSFNGTIMMG